MSGDNKGGFFQNMLRSQRLGKVLKSAADAFAQGIITSDQFSLLTEDLTRQLTDGRQSSDEIADRIIDRAQTLGLPIANDMRQAARHGMALV